MLKKNNEIFDLSYDFYNEENIIDNIYLGRITNIIQKMKGMFVDIGLNKNAYLDFNDLLTKENILKNYHPGMEIIVQVKKNPIGDKGAKVGEKISISTSNIVFLPYESDVLLSRKITDIEQIKRLKNLAAELNIHSGMIFRTNAITKGNDRLIKDILYLSNLWSKIERQKVIRSSKRLLYSENQSYAKFIKDYYQEISYIKVNDQEIFYQLNEKYGEEFDISLLENQILFDCLSRQSKEDVLCSNGIHLNIQETEALTVIDVNSSKFKFKQAKGDLYHVNLLALQEIARQLHVKSISGIIIVDLINIKNYEKRKSLVVAFKKMLSEYKSTVNVYGFTKTGLLELTKKYISKSLFYQCRKNHKTYYIMDHIISKITKIILETQSRKLEVSTNQEVIELMNQLECIHEFFKAHHLKVQYKESKELKIKHLPIKKRID